MKDVRNLHDVAAGKEETLQAAIALAPSASSTEWTDDEYIQRCVRFVGSTLRPLEYESQRFRRVAVAIAQEIASDLLAAEPLPEIKSGVSVLTAKPFRQKGKKYMSKRSGQTGQLFLRNERWIGRFYVDVAGQTSRVRKAVVLGMKNEITKTQAKLKLKTMLSDEGVNTPEHLERSLKPATVFNGVADLWESKRLPQLKESSKYSVPKLLAKHLRSFFGHLALEEIKTGNVNDWIAEMRSKGLEPKTIHNMWKLFRAIMNWHAQQNDEPKRVWYPTLPTIPEEEQRWFTSHEVRRIVEAAQGQYKVLFHLAAYSGLRSGELAGLHVQDVDFVRGMIRVRRSVWKGMEVAPKTRKGYRDVWIDSATVQMLQSHLGSRTAGRVFQSRVGTPLENRDICRRVLKPLCKQLGIEPGGMHAFRHGRVSQLQAGGVPPDFTKSQVGHSSLRTTSGYTHFTEAFKRETVERLASETPSWTQLAKLDSVAAKSN
jgi:integrase